MKKTTYFGIVLVVTMVIATTIGFSAEVGTAGARFLRIGVGARPVALGESFSAIADDVNSIHWNPAGLGDIEYAQGLISHNKWLTDITEQSISYVQPAGNIGTLGGSIRYLHMGKIESYNKDDIQLEDTEAYDINFILSWGKMLGEKSYSGANIKIIQQKLDEKTALGFALDLGFLYKLAIANNPLRLGLVIQNLGTGGTFIDEANSLPINIKTGVAFLLFDEKLILGIDANKPLDEDFYAGLGIEYGLSSMLSFRAGYNMRDSAGSGISLGFGVKSSSWLLDFAYVPGDVFDNTYRISLGVLPGEFILSEKGPDRKKVNQLYKKGMGYMKNKKYADAVNIFTEVLTLDPSHKSALKKLEEANSKMKFKKK